MRSRTAASKVTGRPSCADVMPSSPEHRWLHINAARTPRPCFWQAFRDVRFFWNIGQWARILDSAVVYFKLELSSPQDMAKPVAPNAEEAIAPVIYELGKALYVAQQLETNLFFIVSMLTAESGEVNAKTFIGGLKTHAGRTLGQLAKAFGSKLDLPAEFESYLRKGIDTRNRVMHGFVQRNAEKFQTVQGRAELIEELREAQHVMNERLKFSETVLDRMLQVFGGSMETLRAKAEFNFESEEKNDVPRH